MRALRWIIPASLLAAGLVTAPARAQVPVLATEVSNLPILSDTGLSLVGIKTTNDGGPSGGGSSGGGLSGGGGGVTADLGTFHINIIPGAGLMANPAALTAFNRAAGEWEARISDPITVNINADLAPLGAGILGSTGSVFLAGAYDTIRNAMVADAALDPDDGIVASLPTAANAQFVHTVGTSLTGGVELTKANAKALGFSGLDQAFGNSDASITFSTNFNFDFDNTNGVTAGQYDFQTVAAHEIGHALGFVSAVDDADNGATALSPTPLDLFRFLTSQAPTTAAGFTTTPRDLVPGHDDATDDTANFWRMSTGVIMPNTDGRQASHWKDDQLTGSLIGIMDPTLGSGLVEPVLFPDSRALDLIGYNIIPVPEPASLALFGIGLAGTLAVGWRRRRAA